MPSTAGQKTNFILWRSAQSYLTHINTNVILIVRSVTYSKAKLVLAVHSMQIYFLRLKKQKRQEKDIVSETPVTDGSDFSNTMKIFCLSDIVDLFSFYCVDQVNLLSKT